LLIPEPHGSMQRRLLETEGVVVEGARLDLKRYGWSPRKPAPRGKKRKRADSR
jgi:hypothetical protein